MADNKSYYYIRLKETFFRDDAIMLLESMPDGYLYSNILLKITLMSLKGDGKLMYNNVIPYSPQALATLTGHSVGVVEKALEQFKALGLIDILDNGAIFILNIQNMIGKSTTEADRKRSYERRIAEEKRNLGEISEKIIPEIELEKELDIDTEIDIDNTQQNVAELVPIKPQKKSEPKHKHGEYGHVMLKDSEVEKLNDDYGNEKAQHAIKYLDEYIEMKGYKAKNHNLAIRKWVFDAIDRENKQHNQSKSEGAFDPVKYLLGGGKNDN